eukprot:c25842_g2_i1 orf=362-865(-)
MREQTYRKGSGLFVARTSPAAPGEVEWGEMKKRRSESCGLEDVERSLHTSFCAAANSISQLYTQAQHQHRIAFQAGQRHSLEKLCEWIQRQHQFGMVPATADILNYLKNELNFMSCEESAVTQVQHQPSLAVQCQQPPTPPFARPESPSDEQKFPFSGSFSTGFPTG